jgi:alkylation response protein AidB-like acyl-CoA dehydrogenase
MTNDQAVVEASLQEFIDSIGDPASMSHTELLAKRFDAGLGWVNYPVGEGGLGVGPEWQEVVEQRLHDAKLFDMSDQRASARGLFGPVLHEYASDAIRQQHLRGLFTDEERWCLLLSEPNAGSDLGNLSTRADRDGDHWIVNGQKVWSSLAHKAELGLLLARSDQEAPRYRGLTVYIINMKAPGIEVRPLRQMTGDAEFNEVFFTDVLVPDENRVGEPGAGWGVMMSAIGHERFIIGNEIAMQKAGPMSDAWRAWNEIKPEDPVLQDRMTALWLESEVIRIYSLSALERYQAGRPGFESAVLKLMYTQFIQKAYELIVDISGPQGVLYPDNYEFALYDDLVLDGHDPRRNFLATRARTIGGGTSEVVRTNLGERALGLPKEPR